MLWESAHHSKESLQGRVLSGGAIHVKFNSWPRKKGETQHNQMEFKYATSILRCRKNQREWPVPARQLCEMQSHSSLSTFYKHRFYCHLYPLMEAEYPCSNQNMLYVLTLSLSTTAGYDMSPSTSARIQIALSVHLRIVRKLLTRTLATVTSYQTMNKGNTSGCC